MVCGDRAPPCVPNTSARYLQRVGVRGRQVRKEKVKKIREHVRLDLAEVLLAPVDGNIWHAVYRTVSTDTLTVGQTRRAPFDDRSTIARPDGQFSAELFYYHALGHCYAFAAFGCDIQMANAARTRSHSNSIRRKERVSKLRFLRVRVLAKRPPLPPPLERNVWVVSAKQCRGRKTTRCSLT